MKIFLSYKQTGVSETELKKELSNIKQIIENTWNKTYVYLFDKERENNFKFIIKKVKEKIIKSDLVLWFINHSKKSEWQLIELWIAEWLNKKILFIINERFRDDYFLIYWLKSNVLYYKKIEEVDQLLTNYIELKKNK